MTSAGSAWLAMASSGRPAAASSRPVKGGVPVQARETLAPDKGQVSQATLRRFRKSGETSVSSTPRHTPAWDELEAYE